MFKKVIDYLMSWSDSIVYFEEKPFTVNDVLAVNVIVPSTYEGAYSPHEITSSFTYKIDSLESLLDVLVHVEKYTEVTIQFILNDGRCRYMNLCSHPQRWGITELGKFIDDLTGTIFNDEQSMMFDRGPEVSE